MIGHIRWGRPGLRSYIEVPRLTLSFDRLPKAYDGLVIALVADLHFGRFVGLDYVDRVLRLIREMTPGLVLFGGDTIDQRRRDTEDLCRTMLPFCREIPSIGVLGNHEYFGGVERNCRMMRSCGVDLLVNRHCVLRLHGQIDDPGITIVGLDDLSMGRPNVKAAFHGVDRRSFTILLAHSPDLAEMIGPVTGVDLMLCGHTHGGQISPFGRAIVPNTRHRRYVRGLARGPGFPVYVSRGLGVTAIPLRIGSDPELPIITLRRA